MKVIYLFLITLFLTIASMYVMIDVVSGSQKDYDFCYTCYYPNTYVRVKGKDSITMRKKAFDEYGCTPLIIVNHCSYNTDADGVTTIHGILY